jgi:ATP-dependent Lhr-like helicase
VFDELQGLPAEAVKAALTRSTVKTGLFKRRVIHVARRFGALKKWADFSSVSLQKLVTSFEGTPIYDEGLKEVFTKDLDADELVRVLGSIRDGEIRLEALDTEGNVSPVARVGLERVSMKTDLIPPGRMRAVLVESAKARLLNESGTFVCTNCWDYLEMVRVNDLPDRPKCPRCGSFAVGVLKVAEERAFPLVEKKGQKLTQAEEKLRVHAVETGALVRKYGKVAVVALSARRVGVSDVAGVLEKEPMLSDRFYELVLEAERKALGRRFR